MAFYPFLALLYICTFTLFTQFQQQPNSLMNTHDQSSLIKHVSLYVLQETSKILFCYVSEFNIWCTRKDSDISSSSIFNWATMSITYMMCSRKTLMTVSFMNDNLIITVLPKALFEDSNCSSISFNYSLTLIRSPTEPRMLAEIFGFMNIRLRQLDRSQHS